MLRVLLRGALLLWAEGRDVLLPPKELLLLMVRDGVELTRDGVLLSLRLGVVLIRDGVLFSLRFGVVVTRDGLSFSLRFGAVGVVVVGRVFSLREPLNVPCLFSTLLPRLFSTLLPRLLSILFPRLLSALPPRLFSTLLPPRSGAPVTRVELLRWLRNSPRSQRSCMPTCSLLGARKCSLCS